MECPLYTAQNARDFEAYFDKLVPQGSIRYKYHYVVYSKLTLKNRHLKKPITSKKSINKVKQIKDYTICLKANTTQKENTYTHTQE